MYLLHFYPVDEFAKFLDVVYEVIEECDFDISETRSIDSGHKVFQVPSESSKIKACESREKNAFPRRWGDGKCGGREME